MHEKRRQTLLAHVRNPRREDLSELPRVCELRDGWKIILEAIATLDGAYPPGKTTFRRIPANDQQKYRRLFRALLVPESEPAVSGDYRANIPVSLIPRYIALLDERDVSGHDIRLFASFLASRPADSQGALPVLKKLYEQNRGSEENRALEAAIGKIQASQK